MNPEILRNAWIEATPRRLVIMAVVLALVLLAAHAFGAAGDEPRGGAVAVYAAAGALAYVLLVFWGARNAAEGVLAEIKDRTWDFQRLSALSPLAMTVGKLFGPTLYVWFGGALCIAAMIYGAFAAGPRAEIAGALEGETARAVRPLYDAAIVVLSGVLAQACALAVALLHARGGRQISGVASVLAVLSGLAAVQTLWTLNLALQPAAEGGPASQAGAWYAVPLQDPDPFLAATWAAFALWAVIAVWRLMRRELQVRSTPIAFAAFAAFAAFYVAGFGLGLRESEAPRVVVAAMLAYGSLHGLALAAGFLEPKSVVALRRAAAAWRAGRIGAALAETPAYVVGAIFAAIAAVVVVALAAGTGENGAKVAVVAVAALGFLARDLALVVLFAFAPGARRGAFSALVALGLLYGVGGVFAVAADSDLLAALFFPNVEPVSIAFAWIQAAAALWLARGRLARALAVDPPTAAAPVAA